MALCDPSSVLALDKSPCEHLGRAELERAAGSQLVALRDTRGDRDLQGQSGTGGDALSMALHLSASKNSLEKADNKYWLKESRSGSEGLKWGCIACPSFPRITKGCRHFSAIKTLNCLEWRLEEQADPLLLCCIQIVQCKNYSIKLCPHSCSPRPV